MTNIQRVGMINSNNTQRNSDHDFTKLRKRILGNKGGVESKEQFIFDNDTKKLSAGSDIATAYILCTRPASNPIPNQKFLAQFEFTGSLDFLNITNGDKIFIEIKENLVKDPTLIEDLDSQTNYNQGLGIGEIKIAKNYPSHSNFLKLYEWNDGQLLDLRKAISLPAIDEVAQRTDNLEEKLSTAEGQITQLVEAGTPSYLGITGIVGEKYTMEDTLFLQKTPSFADSTIAINVGDTASNKEQHIQRIASGTTSNQLKLKLKKFGASTTSVVVEVRKGVKVDVSDKEAYRYGGEVIASTTIAYTEFLTDWKEFTLTLNNQFGGTKGELLDIVVYQQGGIVNGTNYYQIACDATQYSEAFSAVAVNGNSRVRNKLMPYCMSEGFVEELVCKSELEYYNKSWSDSLNDSIQLNKGIYIVKYSFSSTSTYPYNLTLTKGVDVIFRRNGQKKQDNGEGIIYVSSDGPINVSANRTNGSGTIQIYRNSGLLHPSSLVEIGNNLNCIVFGLHKEKWIKNTLPTIEIGKIITSSNSISTTWDANGDGILFAKYSINSNYNGSFTIGSMGFQEQGKGLLAVPIKKGEIPISVKEGTVELLYFLYL